MGANLEKFFHLAIDYQINNPTAFFMVKFCQKINDLSSVLHICLKNKCCIDFSVEG